MAEDDGGGGAPKGGKLFGLPRNQVYIGGAVVVAAVGYFIWSKKQAAAATTDTTGTTDSTTDPTTIVPVPSGSDNGITTSEFDQLLAAIEGLQGPPSTAPGSPPVAPAAPPSGPPVVKPVGPEPAPKEPPQTPQPKPPAKTTTPAKPTTTGYTWYTVKSGDNLTKIATEYGTSAAALWAYNIGPSSPHSKAAIAKLKAQGENKLLAGQQIAIPNTDKKK